MHHYVIKKPCIVSIDILNDRLKTFDYHHNGISNNPSLISYDEIKNKKLSMSGSESSNFILFRVLVNEFHMMFAELFPSERFTPKSYNFVHYGTIFQFSGSIRNLSTIRFEAKHKNKKKEANATTSTKNITHSLYLKEQLNLCYRLMTHKGLESNNSYGNNEYVEHVTLCHDYILFN